MQRRMGDLAMKVGRSVHFERIIDGLCARELVREGPEHRPKSVTVSTKNVLELASYDKLMKFADDICRSGSERLSLRSVLKNHGVIVTYADSEHKALRSRTPSLSSSDVEEEPAASTTPRRISGLPAATKSHGEIIMGSVHMQPFEPRSSSGFASSRTGLAGRTVEAHREVASAPKPRQQRPSSSKPPHRGKLPPPTALPSVSASSAGGRASAPPASSAFNAAATSDVIEVELSGAVEGLQGLGTPTPDENKPKGRAAPRGGSRAGEDVTMGSDADGRSA